MSKAKQMMYKQILSTARFNRFLNDKPIYKDIAVTVLKKNADGGYKEVFDLHDNDTKDGYIQIFKEGKNKIVIKSCDKEFVIEWSMFFVRLFNEGKDYIDCGFLYWDEEDSEYVVSFCIDKRKGKAIMPDNL